MKKSSQKSFLSHLRVWIPFSFIVLLGVPELSSIEPPEFYKLLLTEAEYYYFQKRPEISREKLNKLLVEYPTHLEYGYYRLSGKLHEDSGQLQYALEDYEKALQQKKEDSEIAGKLFSHYDSERKLRKAFDFLRIYLALVPEDPPKRLKSLVYSSRLGEKKYFEYALRKIRETSGKENREETIRNLQKLVDSGNFSECKTRSASLIEKFPEEIQYHNYFRICIVNMGSNPVDLEEALINRAAIFFREKKYSLELAQFYYDRKRFFAALNLYRRTFSQGLLKESWNTEEETLLLLRDTYFRLKRVEDARDISRLVELMRRGEHVAEEELANKTLLNRNREFLVYAIHYLNRQRSTKVNSYTEWLKERDSKKADEEFMNIFPVFDYEVNTEF